MLDTLKPFFHLLTKGRFVLSRWVILKTLIRLAVLKRITPNQTPVKFRLGKYSISAPDYHVASALLKEKFVYNEYFFSSSHTAPVIIDGGANIGISVLYFKCLYPEAVIHCFEPSSKAFEFLEKNVQDNHLRNVHLNRVALSDMQQSVSLFIPAAGGFINGTIQGATDGEAEVVEAIRLSTYIAHFRFIDLIKLDVEGSEVAIINDLNLHGGFESRAIRNLIVEFHFSTMEDKSADRNFITLLQSHSFDVKAEILTTGKPQSDLMIRATKRDL